MSAGYCHRQYAESFAEVGRPRELPHCGGWLIERGIPGSTLRDGMGCYPLFDCRTWAGLPLDLSGLTETLVSVTLVTNPFGDVVEADLRRWFDVVIPFKQHYVTDLQCSAADVIGRQHRRNVNKARRVVQVETCPGPLDFLGEWCDLYRRLAVRHAITGLRAFSRAAFEKQLGVPGLVMFRGLVDGEIVGLHLWYVRDGIAYGHLGATSARGDELMASYALYWHAIEHFRERVRWLDLGGGAGISDDAAPDGLRRFKAGWATGTRQTFLCGRVLQPDAYDRLSAERASGKSGYFPAYREGEFASTGERLGVGEQP
jgi:GNAT acetyltransferase-like protein